MGITAPARDAEQRREAELPDLRDPPVDSVIEEQPIAHADLCLCTGAQERIFAPVADFLLEV